MNLELVVDINKNGTTTVTEREFQPGSSIVSEDDIRKIRNSLLQEVVDKLAGNALRWSLLTDAKKSEWVIYRQALLDIPQQPGFPESVIWPQTP